MDASALHAALAAKRRSRPADLSSLSTHAQHLWLWGLHIPRHPLERPLRLHFADACSQLADLPSKRAERLTLYTFGIDMTDERNRSGACPDIGAQRDSVYIWLS